MTEGVVTDGEIVPEHEVGQIFVRKPLDEVACHGSGFHQVPEGVVGVRQTSLQRRSHIEIRAVHRQTFLSAFEGAGVTAPSIPDRAFAKAGDGMLSGI